MGYLTWAIGLSQLETIETISFTAFIAITSINASAQNCTIVIDADVPVLIGLQILKSNQKFERRDIVRLTSHSQTGFWQLSQPSGHPISHGQSKMQKLENEIAADIMNHRL